MKKRTHKALAGKRTKGKLAAKVRLRDGIVFRVMDEEAAVVRPDDGTLMILNETATFILKSIGKGTSRESLVRRIVSEYDTTPVEAERDLNSFLKTLEKEGLIEIS